MTKLADAAADDRYTKSIAFVCQCALKMANVLHWPMAK